MITRKAGRVGRLTGAVALGAVLTAGCTDFAGYDLDYLLGASPVVGTMRTTPAWEPQTMPRMPAPGSVPVASPAGNTPAPFTQTQLDSVGATLVNPLPASAEVLARGATVYAVQCFVCHGAAGEGNGPVVGGGRFPMGPALNGAATAARTDGYLYGVIRVGRGLMPSYGDRVAHEDRWALVHFMRELQQQTGALAAPATPIGGAPPAAPAPVAEPAPDA